MKTYKFVRSKEDRYLSGVCGGLAVSLDIDPLVIRTLFVILTFILGLGIILYILLSSFLPLE